MIRAAISAVAGIGIGPAMKVEKICWPEIIARCSVGSDEFSRLERAIAEVTQRIEKMIPANPHAEIFEAHLLLLQDPEMLDQAKQKLSEQPIGAEQAYWEVSLAAIEMMRSIEDPYLQERALDLMDLQSQVLSALTGVDCSLNIASSTTENVIVVANDLTPSQFLQLDKGRVAGIVLEGGGKTSHTAIMAQAFNIPCLVAAGPLLAEIAPQDLLIVQADHGAGTGSLILRPTAEELQQARAEQNKARQHEEELRQWRHCKSSIELYCNLNTPEEIAGALDVGCDGVGLFRTEFCFMNRTTAPTEDAQVEIYRQILSQMAPRPVIMRTIDVGGDKEISYLQLERELNPFLGVRGIRYCLNHPTGQQLFRRQLRALLRASVAGQLKIMFPMISQVAEVEACNRIVAEIKNELQQEKVAFDPHVEIGIMIEVPAAALIADQLAQHVQFFSIGTNDLLQYLVATDRLNQNLTHLYDYNHPALWRMIEMVCQHAKAAQIKIGMCGSVAGRPEMIERLAAMGFDELSMSSHQILMARKILAANA